MSVLKPKSWADSRAEPACSPSMEDGDSVSLTKKRLRIISGPTRPNPGATRPDQRAPKTGAFLGPCLARCFSSSAAFV